MWFSRVVRATTAQHGASISTRTRQGCAACESCVRAWLSQAPPFWLTRPLPGRLASRSLGVQRWPLATTLELRSTRLPAATSTLKTPRVELWSRSDDHQHVQDPRAEYQPAHPARGKARFAVERVPVCSRGNTLVRARLSSVPPGRHGSRGATRARCRVRDADYGRRSVRLRTRR